MPTPDPDAPLRAVLFDAVGTLIELREPVGATYARFASRFGVDLPAWRLDDAFARVMAGAPPMAFPDLPRRERAAAETRWWREIVRATFRAADGTAHVSDDDAFFRALFVHYGGAEAWQLRPGARAALVDLRAQGLRLGVVSNFDHRLPDLLEALEIHRFMELVLIPMEAGVAKPDADIFETALARLALAPAEVVYVGDDPRRDLAGAAAAGVGALDVSGWSSLAELPAHLRATATLPAMARRQANDGDGDPIHD